MRLRYLRFGGENFAVSLSDAEEIESLRRADPVAALALARRKSRNQLRDGESITVALSVTDALPPELARMAHALSGEPTMSNTIRIGDTDLTVDPRVAAEVHSLRSQVAALSSLQPPRTTTIDSVQIAANAREALLAQQARNNDPTTAQGKYRQQMANAWKNPPAGAHG